jgi:hypothetical protein
MEDQNETQSPHEIQLGANEAWIPLMDYAIKTGISLSTLRRHIKANKLTYKVENGRYLLKGAKESEGIPEKEALKLSLPDTDLGKITHELKKAQEEIAELKTLIAFYEDN